MIAKGGPEGISLSGHKRCALRAKFLWLGQSCAVMAAARKLVTGGPYRFVRHPLYAAELIMILGLILWNLSLTSALLLVAITLPQLRRAHNEEQVLRQAFPEYEDYARRVPKIILRLG